jgi:murein DD-endopeptidase MepM/ murein hydrolase activator NlpD
MSDEQSTALPTQRGSPSYCFPVERYPKGKIPLHWNVSPNAADLFAPKGTPVRAMVNGLVDQAYWDETGGWSVYYIGDPDTKSLHYYNAHLRDKPLVIAGRRVTAGQVIGYVGDTGNAAGTGAHLHIGIGKSIKIGSGPEGGAGVPWPGNNCNKYLQVILDTLGSGPVVAPPPVPPVENPEQFIARLTAEIVRLRKDLDGTRVAIAHLADKTVGDAYREAQKIRAEFLGGG